MEKLPRREEGGNKTIHVGKVPLDDEWLGEGVGEALTHVGLGNLGSEVGGRFWLMAALDGVCGCEGDEDARMTAGWGLHSWLPVFLMPGNHRRDF